MSELGYTVFCGLDVGKGIHHAVALDPGGKRLHDAALPQDEQRLRQLFTGLQAHGEVLVVVDQPATIGALPIAVARDVGCHVAYLPGLAMRRIADLHPGSAKTDARDAFVIAEAARTMPRTLSRVDSGEEVLAEIRVLIGFDDDQAQEENPAEQPHPRAAHPDPPRRQAGARSSSEHHGRTGTALPLRRARRTPRGRQAATADRGPQGRTRAGEQLVTALLAALDEQTVVVPGNTAAEKVLPRLAQSLAQVPAQRRQIAEEVEGILDAHPLAKVLTSMPAVGVRTAARILLEVGDGSTLPTSGHLAAYAGLAPVTRRSGSSTRGEHPPQGGNKQLKRALFLSAFAALADPTSRAYYNRKRAAGKRHNAALICLARRRVDVLFAMLRDGTAHQPQPA
ncbi:IS110 family transposase [Modestobacter sp. VKM Ac-2979]|uniref:IS110 family transposase n=1 Tax=unclassified Modestobacter TaxID=2643866 RepID=UPI0022AB6909|nr:MULTISPECIES: IS110 family transposase [unclassified Modestobacter]MCZ2811966.1 IS110 family transposase [Modestobacter sp. VKM Ac-2979]MCZ2843690.1 IS110 family transposase [Modestobacter sp. VKM Ac-2980]